MNTQQDDLSVTPEVVPSKKKETKKYVLIGVIVVILASLAFYFLYFIKTPVYSLYEIRTAVQNKNVVLLEKRASLKSIYSNAFDDYVSLSVENSTTGSNPLAIVMVKLMKPTIVDTLVERTKTSVENGDFVKGANQKEANVSNVYAIKESSAKEKAKQKISELKNLKITGIKDTVIVDNIAVVSVEALDRNTNKVVIIDLKMTELSDGTWQLVKFDNFKGILKEFEFPYFSELVK